MRDVYPPTHWAIRGAAPAYDTPDEDVYIVGRNVVLLTKAAIACAYRGVGRIAIGPLAGNPFPDATPEFFAAMGRALSLGLAHGIAIEAPFATWEKSAVIARGLELGVPLDRTLSCMSPVRSMAGWRHCGQCSKCRERRDAFAEAGVDRPDDLRGGLAALSGAARHDPTRLGVVESRSALDGQIGRRGGVGGFGGCGRQVAAGRR